MNITFAIWRQTVAKVFSWNIWKKLIVISAVPIVLNAVLFHLLAGDFMSTMSAVQDTAMTNAMSSSPVSASALYASAGFDWIMAIKLLVAILIAIEIAILIIATLHITTRESFKNAENSITHNLFEKASALFGPFHFYLARVIWYAAWPLLAAIPVVALASALDIPVIGMVAPIVGGVVTFYRSIRSAFSVPFFFEFEGENRKEVFEKSLEFSQGKALSIFFSSVGIGFVVGILAIIILGVISAVVSLDMASADPSVMDSLIMSIPSVLFEGVTTVFFYVMYKTLVASEKTSEKAEISEKA